MKSKFLFTGSIAVWTAVCATLCLFLFTSPAMARDHDHDADHDHDNDFRGTIVRVYPSYPWGWDWYGGWGEPYWNGYWPYYYQKNGTVKFENTSRTDQIYINGSYTGEVEHFKSLHLAPGPYRIEVKHNGKDVLDQKVMVIRGKTLRLEVGDKHGTIKIKDAAKTDNVYINGRDRGEVRDIGNIHLRPGTYEIAVENHDRKVLDQDVTVYMGKTLVLHVGDRG